MAQPNCTHVEGYIGEDFITIFFDIDLDDVHPPSSSAFYAQISNSDPTVIRVKIIDGNAVKITFVGTTLVAGDQIDFAYRDLNIGNDVNAVQGLDGTDAADFSRSHVVAITRPGPAAPAAPTLDAGSDSGTAGDFQTSDNTPTLNGTAEANAVVKLYDTDGSTLLGTTTADGSGKWSLTSSLLGDGSHALKVSQTNNQSQTSSLSNALTLTIDTSATPPSGLALSASSDSGTLGDGITNVGTPAITGLAEAKALIKLYDTDGTTVLGTTQADAGGKWTITSSSLSGGLHLLTARQTDAAGNASAASKEFSYRLDTIGPTKLALSTNSVQQVNAGNGATVATLTSDDQTTVTYGFAVGNGVIDADNGKFTISGDALKASQALSAGAYHIYLSATDAAGNDAFQIFVLNVTNQPFVSSIVRSAQAPSMVSASSTAVDYTVVFNESVTGVDLSDFSLTSTGTAVGNLASISGSGNTYTVAVNGIGGDGTLRLDLKSSGTGIKSGSSAAIKDGAFTTGQVYALDHTAPSALSLPSITAATDTGRSSGDANTSNTTPVFTGTGESKATVTLYDTDGTTVLGTTTADDNGNWSITCSTLSEGLHSVTLKQADLAGNVSTASSALSLTIDTTAADAPEAPDLEAGSDSGASQTDNITKETTPVVKGKAEAKALIKLYDTDGSTLLGTTTADDSGQWSITSSTLSDGLHSLTVKQTDVAGNVSKASSALSLTIDSIVPTAPPLPLLATMSDSATQGDNITKEVKPTITGQATAGNVVTLYDTDGTTVIGTATADGKGDWSITSSTLSDGVHVLTAQQSNLAGATSSKSSALSLTIDAAAPTIGSAKVNGKTLTLALKELGSGLQTLQGGTFTVNAGKQSLEITNVTVDSVAGTASLTLASAVLPSDALTLAYAQGKTPSTEAIQDKAGNLLAAFSGLAITNETTDGNSLKNDTENAIVSAWKPSTKVVQKGGTTYYDTNGDGRTDVVKIGDQLLGDLNGDGAADVNQSNVASIGYINKPNYLLSNDSNPDTKPPVNSLVSVVAGSKLDQPDQRLTISGVAVESATDHGRTNPLVSSTTIYPMSGSATTLGSKFRADRTWDALQFTVGIDPITGQDFDVDKTTTGVQVDVLIDISRYRAPVGYFNAYLKWDPLAASGQGGWVNFMRQQGKGDGAEYQDLNGDRILDVIRLRLTDNGRGDTDDRVGFISDPGMPSFIAPPLSAQQQCFFNLFASRGSNALARFG